MSDDDDFMQDSDNENYDFEYEDDDDAEQDGDVDVENKYYNAKQMKAEQPEEAIEEFLGVPALEDEKGDWGFRGLKQAIKLEYRLGRYDAAVDHYTTLLTYVKSAVTRNYSEKSLNNMLDFIEKNRPPSSTAANTAMEAFYSKTLESFQATNNERLWLSTNTKLARLWLAQKDYERLTGKVRELHRACLVDDGSGQGRMMEDPSKGTYSLEAYALEIQMFSEMGNNKRLKSLYNRALGVRSAVPHPKIMGIIRECGGKMHMSEENWKSAQSDFFESFRSYDEAGSLQRIQVLKYLVLTTMLMGSDINPFDSQETKPYKNDPRIAAMTELVDAYQRDDIAAYEGVLGRNRELLEDEFIAENIDEVTRNMRTKAVVKLVAPYTRFKLAFVAQRLNIGLPEVQDILSFLITSGQLRGRINQFNATVEMEGAADEARVKALGDWVESLSGLAGWVLNEGEGLKGVDGEGAGLGMGGGAGMPGPIEPFAGGMSRGGGFGGGGGGGGAGKRKGGKGR